MKKIILAGVLTFFANGVVAKDIDVFVGQYVVQEILNSKGYDVGKPDGVIGKKTIDAINEDSKKHGYENSVWGFQSYLIEKTVNENVEFTNEKIKEEIKEEIGNTLMDPYSAQYKDWRMLKSGSICVDVNAKNVMGAYTGYKPRYVKYFFGTIFVADSSENSLIRDEWYCYLGK